jgi:hypothetical protein
MRKVLEYANAFEPIQDGPIAIEKLNGPFLFEAKGIPAEYKAGLNLAIERGLLHVRELLRKARRSLCNCDGRPTRIVPTRKTKLVRIRRSACGLFATGLQHGF